MSQAVVTVNRSCILGRTLKKAVEPSVLDDGPGMGRIESPFSTQYSQVRAGLFLCSSWLNLGGEWLRPATISLGLYVVRRGLIEIDQTLWSVFAF